MLILSPCSIFCWFKSIMGQQVKWPPWAGLFSAPLRSWLQPWIWPSTVSFITTISCVCTLFQYDAEMSAEGWIRQEKCLFFPTTWNLICVSVCGWQQCLLSYRQDQRNQRQLQCRTRSHCWDKQIKQTSRKTNPRLSLQNRPVFLMSLGLRETRCNSKTPDYRNFKKFPALLPPQNRWSD